MMEVLDMRRKPGYLDAEDNQTVSRSVETLRRELEALHNIFDQVTEPALVDSVIYEMQAVQLRYTYYLELCKERGIVSMEYDNLK